VQRSGQLRLGREPVSASECSIEDQALKPFCDKLTHWPDLDRPEALDRLTRSVTRF
jgi:hypothetical protein